MRIAATARWTAEDGPLTPSPADRAGSSRFVRMTAHVLSALGADREPETRWVFGTCHGPRHDAIEAALGRSHARAFTIPHAVQEVASRLGHRGAVSIVSAGTRTVAMALVEASVRMGEGPVFVVLADESTPAHTHAPIHDALAVALELVVDDTAGPRISAPRRRSEPLPSPPRHVSAAVAASAMWPALALVDAVRESAWGWHALEADRRRSEAGWAVELRPPT
jgi:hypothetical protein